MLSFEHKFYFHIHYKTQQQGPPAGDSGTEGRVLSLVTETLSPTSPCTGDLKGPKALGAVTKCHCEKPRLVVGFINRNMTARVGMPPIHPPHCAAGPNRDAAVRRSQS